jgi:hypothetical protein
VRRILGQGARLAVVAAAVLALSACGTKKAAAPTTTTATTSTTAATTTTAQPAGTALPVSLVRFAEYQPVPLMDPNEPAYAGPATPHSLAEVTIAKSLQAELKAVPELGPLLEKQSFAVVPAGSSLFQAEYEGNTYGGWPVYVTTDAAYNAWHLAFDKILRDLEQQVLLPKLEHLVTDLVKSAKEQQTALAGTPLADDASRATQIYELAAAELGLPVTLGPLAQQEKALVDAHTATSQMSPLLGTTVDYSNFTPRGHYTLTPALTRYFVAMSVLGQLAFCLPGTTGCPGLEPTRIGILATHLLGDQGSDDVTLWHDIYDPTSFLVGLSDDYTPEEVTAAFQQADLGQYPDMTVFAKDANVTAVVRALRQARTVRIDPQRASIRIMGTRFVTDEYLLDQLVFPLVGTSDKPRSLPTGLDVAASFGSPFAVATQKASGASDYANYDAQLASNQAAVAGRDPADWGSTVYDAWLAAIQPMFVPHGTAFPDYMRTDAWAAKDTQSGLGSYTELKHDTILYAKQLVAEAGGEPVIGNPRNWVEPDPVAFERLGAATDLLSQGLEQRGLLTADAGSLLATETDLFRFLGRVATEELAGQTLAAADNHRLRFIGDELSAIWWRTSERSNPDASIPNQSAIVADIASGPTGVLELATGAIDTLYVIVPSANGGFELARGGVYSYYEFTNPPGSRLTDAAWRAMLAAGNEPARPSWQSVLLASCPDGKAACSPSYVPG